MTAPTTTVADLVPAGPRRSGAAGRTARTPAGRRRGGRTLAGRLVVNAAAVVVFAASMFPVYWMVTTSLLPNRLVRRPDPLFVPVEPTLSNYHRVIVDESQFPFLDALRNSLAVTLLTVVGALLLALLAALALTRYRFRGRRWFILVILAVQMLPGEAMILSIYHLLDGWDLTNTIIGLTIVYIAAVLPFTIWTLRGFIAGVPVELEEAAMVDGCSRFSAYRRVTFPLVAPGLVATGVFAFIQAWNEFVTALVLMNRPENLTLPVWLRSFNKVNAGTDWAGIMAGSTLMTIPVVIFFLAVQSRMSAGIVQGAVKG
ncbi:MAG TPA: carbohydrate ABC transporter permease [Actinomycetales bacterium]|nr:carbohydrate ABC transporter permease [Actinomycetales bacterium]